MAQPLAFATYVAACLLWSSKASSVAFADEAGPEQYYLHGRYRFFVAANSISGGVASWKLSNMKFQPAQEIKVGAKLHALLVPTKMFKSLVDEFTPMCDESHTSLWSTMEGVVATTLTTEPKTEDLKIPHGGPYMLVLANCEVACATTISGSIGVQNSWGSLDNVDYWKVPIYGCALVLMVVTFLVYVAFVAQQEEDVRDMQYYCILLSILGVVEATAQCVTLYLENSGEIVGYHVVDALYLSKVMYGFTFILQIAQGLGTTTNTLDWMASAKCYLIVLSYLVAVVPKICLLSIRPHLAKVHTGDVLISAGPLAIVVALALAWFSWSLQGTFSMLRKRDDTDALKAVKRIALLVFVVITVAAGTLLVQIILGKSQEKIKMLWMYAFWNDAVASASCFVATVAIMFLSMENHAGKSLQIGALPTQEVDLEIDEEEDESVLVDGKSPVAETIGATAALE